MRKDIHSTNPVEIQPENNLSFTGAKFKGKKAPVTLSTLASAALGILGLKKSGKEDVKSEAQEELDQSQKDYAEFFEAMKKQKFPYFSVFDSAICCYPDDVIPVIYKYKKEDPVFAYELAKVLQNKSKFFNVNESQAEYLAKNLKERPEVVEGLKVDGRPATTCALLKAYENNPHELQALLELNKERDDSFKSDEIISLILSYKSYPNAVAELARMKKDEGESGNFFNSLSIKELAPTYEEDKENILKLKDLLKDTEIWFDGESIVELLNSYKEYPEVVEKFIKKTFSTKQMNKLVDNYRKNEGMITLIKESLPDIDLSDTDIVNLANLSDDEKKFVPKALQDKRVSKVDDILRLAPVYMAHPEGEITDAMVERFYDPLAKIFNI